MDRIERLYKASISSYQTGGVLEDLAWPYWETGFGGMRGRVVLCQYLFTLYLVLSPSVLQY